MNRPTYWLFYVIVVVGMGILAYFGKLNGGMETAMILVGVPRLHDIGRSGWIIGGIILAEIVIIGGAVFAGASVDTIETIAGAIVLALAALGIWLGIVPGDVRSNKWGEPPSPGIDFRRPKRAA